MHQNAPDLKADATLAACFKPWSLILAAGAGRRLGHNKPLFPFAGTSMLCSTVTRANSVTARHCLVVTGHAADRLLPTLTEMGCAFTHNESWPQGMGSSIAHGIRALPKNASHCLLLPVDQPLIPRSGLAELLAAAEASPQSIVVSEFSNTTGPPVILPRRCFARLADLSGDSGARTVISQETELIRVALPEAEYDVDDLDSAQAFARRLIAPDDQ